MPISEKGEKKGIEFHTYQGMYHETCMEELADLTEFLEERSRLFNLRVLQWEHVSKLPWKFKARNSLQGRSLCPVAGEKITLTSRDDGWSYCEVEEGK